MKHVIVVDDFDFAFAENGLTAYKMGKVLPSQSFIKFVGEDRYKKLVNFILHYLADIDLPIKRYLGLPLLLCTHPTPRQRHVRGIPERNDQCQPHRT